VSHALGGNGHRPEKAAELVEHLLGNKSNQWRLYGANCPEQAGTPTILRSPIMPGPRPEDGHLRITNEVVEHLAQSRVNGTQWRILWAVWRKTLCWQKLGQWTNAPYPISLGRNGEERG